LDVERCSLQRHFVGPVSLSFATEANKRPMTTTMTIAKTSISSRKIERKKERLAIKLENWENGEEIL